MFDRQAHFEAGVAGLGLEFDFTAVPVGHNAIADHQTQNVAGTGNNLQITAPAATTNVPARYYRARLLPLIN